MNIGIIDYPTTGNYFSVKKAVKKAGGHTIRVCCARDLHKVDKVILPGVGSFSSTIEELGAMSLISELRNFDRPLLGICVGMQVLAKIGFEGGVNDGLGVIDGEVCKIITLPLVPHVGFSKINVMGENETLKDLQDEEFYYMHSYEVINYQHVSAISHYKSHDLVAAVKNKNFYGVQFHPEKSRDPGIQLLTNFINI